MLASNAVTPLARSSRPPSAAGPVAPRRVLEQLAFALDFDPLPRSSLLLDVEAHRALSAPRFERGDGSFEQWLHASEADEGAVLPLPVTWVLRALCDVGAALCVHANRESRGLDRLRTEHVLLCSGETLLDVSALEPMARRSATEPDPASIKDMVRRCLLGVPSGTRSLARELRPGLPSTLVHWLDARTPAATTTAALERVRLELDGLLGARLAWPTPTERTPSQIARWQLRLLPAARALLGAERVARWFARNAERWVGRTDAFSRAFRLHAASGVLASLPDVEPELVAARRSVQLRRVDLATEHLCRMHFALSRGDVARARLDAVSAATRAPEHADVWLVVAELWARLGEPSGVALCLAEALCAARGADAAVDAIARRSGTRSRLELARWFNGHGHPQLGRWLSARRAHSAPFGKVEGCARLPRLIRV